MFKKVLTNIIYSFAEQAWIAIRGFLVTWLLIHNLQRSDYGIIGVIAGYYALLTIFNISLEAIVLKDHKEYSLNLQKYFTNFVIFNSAKAFIMLLAMLTTSIFLYSKFGRIEFLYVGGSQCVIFIANVFSNPLIYYSSSIFKQKTIALISASRYLIDLVLVIGIIIYPSLKYLFYKDLIVTTLFLTTWIYIAKKHYGLSFIKLDLYNNFDYLFIKKSLVQYSLWTHLSMVINETIFRSDLFFLSWFVSLSTAGNYNIALNSANWANIFLQMLGYQSKIAISNTNSFEEAKQKLIQFIYLSFLLSAILFIFYYFGGMFYIHLLTGNVEQDTWKLMMYIVIGLLISEFIVLPTIAFINIKGSVKRLLLNVILPTGFLTLIIYYISARFYGAPGIAISNIFVCLIWLMFTLIELKYYGIGINDIFNIHAFKGIFSKTFNLIEELRK